MHYRDKILLVLAVVLIYVVWKLNCLSSSMEHMTDRATCATADMSAIKQLNDLAAEIKNGGLHTTTDLIVNGKLTGNVNTANLYTTRSAHINDDGTHGIYIMDRKVVGWGTNDYLTKGDNNENLASIFTNKPSSADNDWLCAGPSCKLNPN